MAGLVEKYFDYLQLLHITVKYTQVDAPRVIFLGQNPEKLKDARNYMVRHVEIIQSIAKEAGYDYDSDSGLIETAHELEVYAAVISPLNAREECIRDFWLERQAMRKADGLADDFHSTWLANIQPDSLGNEKGPATYVGDIDLADELAEIRRKMLGAI